MKLKAICLLTLALLAGQAHAGAITGVRMLAPAGCTNKTFLAELTTKAAANGFTIPVKYAYRTAYTAVITRADWVTALKAYDTEVLGYATQKKTVPETTKAKLTTILNSVKAAAETPCAKVYNVDSKSDFSMLPSGGSIEMNVNYGSSATQYPLTSAGTRIVVVDTVMSATSINPAHNVISGTSLVPNPSVDSTLTTTTHGNSMAYVAAMASSGVPVISVAVSGATSANASNEALVRGVSYGINESVKTGTGQSVMNMSISNYKGYSPALADAVHAYVQNGGVFVAAMGNFGAETWAGNTYLKDMVRVGATVNGKMVTDYGVDGPDLVVPLDGITTLPGANGATYSVNAANYGGSGASAVISGLMAAMRNQYNYLTPQQIKEAFCESADLLPTIADTVAGASEENRKNSYIRCGVVNFQAAMEYARDKFVNASYSLGGWVYIFQTYAWDNSQHPYIHKALSRGCNLKSGYVSLTLRGFAKVYTCISIASGSTLYVPIYGAQRIYVTPRPDLQGYDGWYVSPVIGGLY